MTTTTEIPPPERDGHAVRTTAVAVSQAESRHSVSSYTLPYYATEVDAVHESIQRAIDLVQFYSEQAESTTAAAFSATTSTTPPAISTDPDEIYQQLDTARNQITKSWQALYTAFHSTTKDDDDGDGDDNDNTKVRCTGSPLTEREQIRIAYLNMITDSFGNVLEQLHHDQNENHVNVDVLADCLQSGYDLLTQFNASSSSSPTWYESDFVWNDDDNDDNDDDDNNDTMNDIESDDDNDNTPTPHERHRQQLGFQEVH